MGGAVPGCPYPSSHPLLIFTESMMKTWQCIVCGYIYDESAGDPEHGIVPGTRWADVPEDWACPD